MFVFVNRQQHHACTSLGLGIAFLGTLFLLGGHIAHAATITVNTLDDELNSDGDCALREAITAANSDAASDACVVGGGTDTIDFSVSGTITLGGSALPTITEGVTIDGGSDVTIDADNNSGIFVMNATGESITIDALTMTNGSTAGAGGALSITNGTVTITNSVILNSTSGTTGGGIYVNANDRDDTTGLLNLTDSRVSGNISTGSGGGIYASGAEQITRIQNSTLSGNIAGGNGGGLSSATDGAQILVSNSTLSGNSADNGGGIEVGGETSLTVWNTTITNNEATESSAEVGIGDGGGVWISVAVGTTATLNNALVAGNTAVDSGADIEGEVTATNVLVSSIDGTTGITDGVNGNIVDITPGLIALADNGGTTQTHALESTSPAVDAGSNILALETDGSTTLTLDQRGTGFDRVQDSTVDIGAFEGGILTYSTATFTEASANDGTIDNTTPATITVSNDTFSGSNNDDFVVDGKLVVTNTPSGLTVVATRSSATQLSITITGTATIHENADDVIDLTFTFQDSAFTEGDASVLGESTKNDLSIDFEDAAPVVEEGSISGSSSVSFLGQNTARQKVQEQRASHFSERVVQRALTSLFVRIQELGLPPDTLRDIFPEIDEFPNIFRFTRNLGFGDSGEDVRVLQQFLNLNGFGIFDEGPGSLGQETVFFGERTEVMVSHFQDFFQAQILDPVGLSFSTGYFGNSTRTFVNNLFADSTLFIDGFELGDTAVWQLP